MLLKDLLSAVLAAKAAINCFSTDLGYPCCRDSEIAYTDEEGQWGYENGEKCGISDVVIDECLRFKEIASPYMKHFTCMTNSQGKISDLIMEYVDDNFMEIIKNYPTIESLEIQTEKRIKLDLSSFETFTKLTSLTLSGPNLSNKYRTFEINAGSLKVLKSIENLHISKCSFSQENINEIGSLTKLTNLSLINSEYPDNVTFSTEKLKNLTNLKISNNYYIPGTFTEIPSSFLNCTSLKEITFNYQSITMFPDLSKLKNLESLSLKVGKINDTIPESYNSLTNLKSIVLNGNPSIKGKTLDIDSLETCIYYTKEGRGRPTGGAKNRVQTISPYTELCKTKEMNCFGKEDTFNLCE